MRSRIQPRDLEVLRTLVRLRYVTSRDLIHAFFPAPEIGRRRLRILSASDYIRSHNKGLPPRSPYCAWRITSRGIDLVARELPHEHIPDGLAERVAEGSLYNLEHHEAICRVYFDLVIGSPVEDCAAQTAAICMRANRFAWANDGDVVLSSEYLGKKYEVVPDATLRTKGVALFLELDRSSKPLGRIRENLERYARYLSRQPGATVVYVVLSEGRKKSITHLCE